MTLGQILGIKKNISNQMIRAIMTVNILVLSVVFIVLFLYFRNVMIDESLEMANIQLDVNIKEFNKEFSNIESAVSVIHSVVESSFDVDEALKDTTYVEEFNTQLVDELKLIGERTDMSSSVYVYFNYELWGRAIDTWMLRVAEGEYVKQDVIPIEFYEENYRPWYEIPINEKRSIWTFPYLSLTGDNEGQIISSFVSPIEIDGYIIGLAGMDLLVSDVAKALENSRIYDTGEIYMLHPDGRTIYHPNYEFGKVPDELNSFDLWLDKINRLDRGSSIEIDKQGKEIVLAYARLENGWIMASMIPQQEVFSVVGNMLLVMMGILALSLVVTLLISRALSHRITKPIEEISSALSEISQGNFEKSIPINLFNSSTEIEELARSAEFMRENLNDAFKKIEFDKEHLEQVVEQRTKELSDVNKELLMSLEAIEEQQQLLIEAERHKLSRYLIQNLSHRLNTPIGSTVIAVDFLNGLLKDSNDSVLKSLEIISNSQQKLKEIGDSLGILMMSYDDVKLTPINLKDTIDVCMSKYMFENEVELNIKNHIDEGVFVLGSGSLYLNIIHHLLTYSMKKSCTNMMVEIIYDKENCELIYKDHATRIDTDDNIFEPYSSDSFSDDQSGLELFIVYDIVTRGLGETIYHNKGIANYLDVRILLNCL